MLDWLCSIFFFDRVCLLHSIYQHMCTYLLAGIRLGNSISCVVIPSSSPVLSSGWYTWQIASVHVIIVMTSDLSSREVALILELPPTTRLMSSILCLWNALTSIWAPNISNASRLYSTARTSPIARNGKPRPTLGWTIIRESRVCGIGLAPRRPNYDTSHLTS